MDNHIGKEGPIYKIIGVTEERYPEGHKKYILQCKVCGEILVDRPTKIKKVKSCRHKNIVQKTFENGGDYSKFTNPRLRNIFDGMIHRCYDPKEKSYRWYGAKGIKVCSEWIEHPEKFEEWSIANGYENTLTIDRIDSAKDYCPENCRWITNINNSRYKSSTRVITIGNKTMSGRQWAVYLGTGVNRINNIARGKGEEAAIDFIQKQLETIVPEKTQ